MEVPVDPLPVPVLEPVSVPELEPEPVPELDPAEDPDDPTEDEEEPPPPPPQEASIKKVNINSNSPNLFIISPFYTIDNTTKCSVCELF